MNLVPKEHDKPILDLSINCKESFGGRVRVPALRGRRGQAWNVAKLLQLGSWPKRNHGIFIFLSIPNRKYNKDVMPLNKQMWSETNQFKENVRDGKTILAS